jgi:hypothetical protein
MRIVCIVCVFSVVTFFSKYKQWIVTWWKYCTWKEFLSNYVKNSIGKNIFYFLFLGKRYFILNHFLCHFCLQYPPKKLRRQKKMRHFSNSCRT